MKIRGCFLIPAERFGETLAVLSPILAAFVLAIRIAYLAMSKFRARA